MKNFLLGFFTAALIAIAVFTRPTESESRAYVARQNITGAFAAGAGGDARLTYADRILWVEIVRDGRTISRGAFNTWFPGVGVSSSRAEGSNGQAANTVEGAAVQVVRLGKRAAEDAMR